MSTLLVVGLRHALGHERNRRDSAAAGARRDACPFALDPRFERERRRAEAWRLPESHICVRPAEVDGKFRGQRRIGHAGRHDGQGVCSGGFAVAGREREHVGADCGEGRSRVQRGGIGEYDGSGSAGLGPLHGTDGRTVRVDDGAGESGGRGQRHRLIGAGKNHGRQVDRRGGQRGITAGHPAPARALQHAAFELGGYGACARKLRRSVWHQTTGRVHDAAGAFVEAPPRQESGRIRHLPVDGCGNLRRAARVIPDARFIERAGEEAGRETRRVQRRAERRVLNAVRPRHGPGKHGRAVRHAVQVQLQRVVPS